MTSEEYLEHRMLSEFIDISLMTEDSLSAVHPDISAKAVTEKTSPKEVIPRIRNAKCIYIHPNGFDRWTDILLKVAEREKIPVKLFIISESDYAIGDEHMDVMTGFFPEAEFWIQNWCGSLKSCRSLPLGVNAQYQGIYRKKKIPLGMSFCLNYMNNPKREEFFNFLQTNPEIQQYCLPRADYKKYCEQLSECFFTTCPMGEGFDTYRFWEVIMMGCIPIVKQHAFYETLLAEYPDLPIYMIEDWTDLIHLIPKLNEEFYNEIIAKTNTDCLKRTYWQERYQALVPQQPPV